MKAKVKLEGVMETMLIPLAAKADESNCKYPRIMDREAVKMKEMLDYDFTKFEKKMSQEGVIARTIILDRQVQQDINRHPNANCICIGCGLDTRYQRLHHQNVQWYNLDFAEVMDLRKKLIEEGDKVHNIAKSALDPTWIQEVKNRDRETIIILEGILMYLTETEVKSLLQIITSSFTKCTIYMELMHPMVVKQSKHHDTVKETNAVFKWGIKQAKDVEKLCGGLKYKQEWNLFEVLTDRGVAFKIANALPFIRDKNNRIAKYESRRG